MNRSRIESGGGPPYPKGVKGYTDRKRVAKDLHAAKQAVEAVSRARSELLARVSHQSRTPTNAAQGSPNC